MLVIYVNSRINRRSRGEVRELLITSAWRQFPTLLSAPAVENSLKKIQENRDSELDQSWEYIIAPDT
jgi:hypothetical protein